jgi:hypothetical protein
MLPLKLSPPYPSAQNADERKQDEARNELWQESIPPVQKPPDRRDKNPGRNSPAENAIAQDILGTTELAILSPFVRV